MHPRDARRRLGLSVNQFAAALGVAPQTVRRWELSEGRASKREPGAATITAINLLLREKELQTVSAPGGGALEG